MFFLSDRFYFKMSAKNIYAFDLPAFFFAGAALFFFLTLAFAGVFFFVAIFNMFLLLIYLALQPRDDKNNISEQC